MSIDVEMERPSDEDDLALKIKTTVNFDRKNDAVTLGLRIFKV